MKKYLVVTGGAGFIGTNLIKNLLKSTNYKIISIDDYSSGKKSNEINSLRVNYLKGNTIKIETILRKYKNRIKTIFHFGEFSRIYQSFQNFSKCFNSNSIGSNAVFNFCLQNKIKLIYSATSASLGNGGNDKNLSPYAFSKAKNLEMLENLKKWFNLKFEVIYFYNVYGPNQISSGKMATVIGIFETQYIKKFPLTVVKPGTQSRRFTHVDDTIKICIEAWKKNKCLHYSISSKKSYSIYQVARMFSNNIKILPYRAGERYASALTKISMSNKIYKRYGRTSLINYIKNFKKKI